MILFTFSDNPVTFPEKEMKERIYVYIYTYIYLMMYNMEGDDFAWRRFQGVFSFAAHDDDAWNYPVYAGRFGGCFALIKKTI